VPWEINTLHKKVLFGAKEAYMLPVNAFMEKNTERLRAFFDEITVCVSLFMFSP